MSIGIESQPGSKSALAEQSPLNRASLSHDGGANSANESRLWESIQRFDAWLGKVGYESYDPYDFWGTKYGLFSRRVYYKRGVLALPLIAPILLMDVACPSMRGLFVAKERFATADGQLILSF